MNPIHSIQYGNLASSSNRGSDRRGLNVDVAKVPVLDIILGDDAKDAEVPVRGVGRGGGGDGTGDLGELVAVGGRPEGDGA